jgi:hypothetical protein
MIVHSKKKFYPVIHCIDPYEKGGIGHAIVNTRTAVENGADGVFLIGHNINYLDMTNIYGHVRKQFPNIWIGINFLDISAQENPTKLEAILLAQERVDAIWTDQLPSKKLLPMSGIKVFGSIAFKYINPNPTPEDLAMYCKNASKFVNIATTSGNKTGEPPDIEKLRAMHLLLDGTPLALASGVDEQNILPMLPYVDHFLVASSISKREYNYGGCDYLIPKKVEKLADIIHR